MAVLARKVETMPGNPTRRPLIRFASVSAAILALAGCSSLQGIGKDTSGLPGVAVSDVQGSDALSGEEVLTNADLVRAPEVFSASGYARWDGRRTARGVWVAHPKVARTMPVRIVHPASGLEVDGRAYHARTREGSDLMAVSSDTAEALRLSSGQKARLSIFALRPRDDLAPPSGSAESEALAQMANHIAGMDHARLAQLPHGDHRAGDEHSSGDGGSRLARRRP